MKTREGVSEKDAIGGVKPEGTTWRMFRRDSGEECRSVGKTAFEAAARKGWAMGELSDIYPVRLPF